jgi:hypothetical protein
MFLSDYCSPEYLDDMAEKLFGETPFMVNGIPFERTTDEPEIGSLMAKDDGYIVQARSKEHIDSLLLAGAKVIRQRPANNNTKIPTTMDDLQYLYLEVDKLPNDKKITASVLKELIKNAMRKKREDEMRDKAQGSAILRRVTT